MDRYCLAKLVQWAGSEGVIGRKRLQKVVYLLQGAGCPFGAEYHLHHYGPYSRDVAEACDELVAVGLLDEQTNKISVGTQYVYKVSTKAGELAIAETETRQSQRAKEIATFESLANELLTKDLWELELGSTILYFYEKVPNWNDAVRHACKFKNIDQQSNITVPAAEALAKSVRTEFGPTSGAS